MHSDHINITVFRDVFFHIYISDLSRITHMNQEITLSLLNKLQNDAFPKNMYTFECMDCSWQHLAYKPRSNKLALANIWKEYLKLFNYQFIIILW